MCSKRFRPILRAFRRKQNNTIKISLFFNKKKKKETF